MQGYGGMNITDGSTAQALSTTQAAMTAWNTAAGSNVAGGYERAGNVAARGDKANNRLLLAPGIYRIHVNMSGVVDVAQDITAQLAKNGNAITGTKFAQRFGTTISSMTYETVIEVKASDAPGTIPSFPEPASGYGAAPKMMIPITILLSSGAGTPNLTINQANMYADKQE